MGFLGFGRSGLKSADPNRRREALMRLQDADQRQFLAVALNDTDPGVRLYAARRVSGWDRYKQLTGSSDQKVAQAGRDGMAAEAGELVMTASAAQADDLLPLIRDHKVVVSAALKAQDASIRAKATERILSEEMSEATLRTLAVDDEGGELALKVLERIETRSVLKVVAKKAKAQVVREAAAKRREFLAEEAAKPSPEKQRRLRLQGLKELQPKSEALALTTHFDDLDQRWADFEAERDAVLADFEDLELDDTAKDALAAMERAKARSHARREEAAAVAAAQIEAIAACEAFVANLGEHEPDTEAWTALVTKVDDPTERGRLQSLLKRSTAVEVPEIESVEADAPAQTRPEPNDEEKAQMEALVVEAEGLKDAEDIRAAEDTLRELHKKLTAISHGLAGTGEFHGRLKAVREAWRARREEQRSRRDAEAAQRIEQLKGLLGEAETFAASADAKNARQLSTAMKALRDRWRKVGNAPAKDVKPLRKSFDAALEKVNAKVQAAFEAESWARFAKVPDAEKLIEQAEALAEEATVEGEDLQKQVRNLQQSWKKLGSLPRERNDDLWGRFRTACDAVYERLQPHFAAQDEARTENLALKKKLIEKLEIQLESDPVGLPGSAASADAARKRNDIAKEVMDAWKATGPVPRDHAEDINSRYKALLDRYHGLRRQEFAVADQERQENLKAKEELVAKAVSVAEEVALWQEGKLPLKEQELFAKVKDLQREWRGIGFVPREKKDEVGSAFKQACDKVYEALEEWLQKEDESRKDNLDAKEAVLREFEEIFEEENPTWFREQVREIRGKWRDIGPVPRADFARVNDAFRVLNQRFDDLD